MHSHQLDSRPFELPLLLPTPAPAALVLLLLLLLQLLLLLLLLLLPARVLTLGPAQHGLCAVYARLQLALGLLLLLTAYTLCVQLCVGLASTAATGTLQYSPSPAP
jgi:hypothetical protein